MQVTETQKVTVERKEVKSILCDMCGVETYFLTDAEREKPLREEFGFTEEGFGASSDVTVSIKMSNGYGDDGGGSKTISIDVCPTCFKQKIMPLAKQYREIDTDY